MAMELQSDIDQLSVLSQSNGLLKERYRIDKIYTWASTTLVAVNPYKCIDSCYSQTTQQQLCDISDKPHIYSIAENAIGAIKQMYAGKSNASIIVSGESGSGKTESTKYLLRYLTVVKSGTSTKKKHAEHIEQHILAFNPVLESFGNACTSCNDNSSRFGKYIVLQFDKEQSIAGAHIQTYLLEKTRIVHQGPGNFNFHIFYQFLAGLSESERDIYLVPGTKVYHYAKCEPKSGERTQTWQNTLKAWQSVGFTSADQHEICTILGAILCLGNIDFVQTSDDGTDLSECSSSYMEKASILLGVETRTLRQVMLFRSIAASHARRKSVFLKPCSLAEASTRRDSLAKMLYDRLFSWLVQQINLKIKCDEYSSFIGLLDIYGFECFSVNSLEQLCINYANERLQHYFVQYYLKDIQAEYAEEGVSWQHVNVTSDNESCVRLMSTSPGIFSVLNEECQLNRLNLDDKIAEKIFSSLKPHPSLVCTQKDVVKKSFSIHHYASTVSYSTAALVEKNKDLLPDDIISTLAESEREFICHLADSCTSVERGKQQKKTVLSRFKYSLDELLSRLQKTECQYVRCIKPNKQAKSGLFDSDYVGKQLKACGVMETVKIRSQAHAIRMSYEEFLYKYRILRSRWTRQRVRLEDKENEAPSTPQSARLRRRTLLPSTEHSSAIGATPTRKGEIPGTPGKSVYRKVCTGLLLTVIGPSMSKLVSFGTTKLFIKDQDTMEMFDTAKNKKLSLYAFTIQCAWRKWRLVKYHQTRQKAVVLITKTLRNFVKSKREKIANLASDKETEVEMPWCKDVSVVQDFNLTTETNQADESSRLPISRNTEETLAVAVNRDKGRNVFRRYGIVSIRHISNAKIRFHIQASSLLKHSHVLSKNYTPQSSLLDCLREV